MRVINEYYRRPRSGKENRQNNLLHELEKDHRNLVKHCLNMEAEIKYPSNHAETTRLRWPASTK